MKKLFYLVISFFFILSVTAENSTPVSPTPVPSAEVPVASDVANTSSVNGAARNVFYVCKREREVRWLRVFMTESNSKCKTMYSKEGYIQVVSSATYFSSCESVLLNVKKNIEDGGFKCQVQQLGSMIEIE